MSAPIYDLDPPAYKTILLLNTLRTERLKFTNDIHSQHLFPAGADLPFSVGHAAGLCWY